MLSKCNSLRSVLISGRFAALKEEPAMKRDKKRGMKESKISRSSRTESRCLIRSPCFTSYSFGLHDRSSYMPSCWCWCGVGLFVCLFGFGFCRCFLCPCNLASNSSSLAQDDLCNLCAHGVSTRAKKKSDLFRRRLDEQRYSQTDCNVWLKSGVQKKGDATASVFSHGSGAPRILRVRGRRFVRKENCV